MSTRSQIRTKLRTELSVDPNGKAWSDSVLNWFINSAYFQLQKDWDFNWRENDANTTFSTVVWTQEYSLPSDFIRANLVRYNGTQLYVTDKIDLKREIQTFQNGIPSRYYLYWSYIWFDVLPSEVKTIDFDYKKSLATLDDDTDSSAFSSNFDDCLVKYASFLAWSVKRGNEWIAQGKLQEYQLLLDTLLNGYIYDVSNIRFNNERSTFWVSSRALY